jgi:gas vesicle protein
MSSGKVLLGVLGGIAAGALLGILFAPDKGSNTRKKVVKKGEDYAEAIQDKFDDFLESFSEKFEKMKEEYTEFVKQDKAVPEEPQKEAGTA